MLCSIRGTARAWYISCKPFTHQTSAPEFQIQSRESALPFLVMLDQADR